MPRVKFALTGQLTTQNCDAVWLLYRTFINHYSGSALGRGDLTCRIECGAEKETLRLSFTGGTSMPSDSADALETLLSRFQPFVTKPAILDARRETTPLVFCFVPPVLARTAAAITDFESFVPEP